jgi:hypothetical protein
VSSASSALSNRWQALAARLPGDVRSRTIAEARVIRLPGNVPPWTDTGMRIAKGDEISILAEGRIVTAADAGLHLRPRYALWARVAGRGPIWTGTRDTQTFRGERDGVLELALYNGEWKTPDGVLGTPVEAYAGVSGEIEALVIRWHGEAAAGLEAVRRAAPEEPLFATELERLEAPAVRPAGWSYLWFLGQSEIYRAQRANGTQSIACRCDDDVAILRRPIDVPLDQSSQLRWRWRIDQLPSRKPEDFLLSHDYLSVAVEFENGRDLSWYWSSSLPVGKSFACPIPQWTARETHWVVRSGDDGLGAWQSERRPILADYRAAIGEPLPRRAVAVWLIAVSLFQHGQGLAEYADLAVESGGKTVEVIG